MSGRGATTRKISQQLKQEGVRVHDATVCRVISSDLGKKSLQQQKVHRISDKNKRDRIDFCERTLAAIGDGSLDLDRVIFSDETTIRCSRTTLNPRNCRVYVNKKVKKKDLPADLITKPVSGFSEGIMVHLCVTKIGPMPPVFCPAKAKVNADKYIELLTLDVIPNIVELADLNTVTWQEDNATAHTAKKTRAFAASKFPHRMSWPAQSPDLSPLDYCINDYVKEAAAQALPEISKPEEVRAAVKKVVREMPRSVVEKAIDHFPQRLRLCVAQGGGHIEHCK